MKSFRKLVAETGEACDLVALSNDDIDRQSHAQDLLRLPEFLVETRRSLFELIAALMVQFPGTSQAAGGNREYESVERALGPVLLQQTQDRVPAAMVRCAVAAQHKISGDVDNHAFVEEVPIQFAAALVDQLVYRFVETITFEQRCFSGFRFAGNEIPRRTIAIVVTGDVSLEDPQRTPERSTQFAVGRVLKKLDARVFLRLVVRLHSWIGSERDLPRSSDHQIKKYRGARQQQEDRDQYR